MQPASRSRRRRPARQSDRRLSDAAARDPRGRNDRALAFRRFRVLVSAALRGARSWLSGFTDARMRVVGLPLQLARSRRGGGWCSCLWAACAAWLGTPRDEPAAARGDARPARGSGSAAAWSPPWSRCLLPKSSPTAAICCAASPRRHFESAPFSAARWPALAGERRSRSASFTAGSGSPASSRGSPTARSRCAPTDWENASPHTPPPMR